MAITYHWLSDVLIYTAVSQKNMERQDPYVSMSLPLLGHLGGGRAHLVEDSEGGDDEDGVDAIYYQLQGEQ